MADQLKLQKQVQIIAEWRDEIDTCMARLDHASQNALRAVAKWQDYIAIASPTDQAATGAAIAAELLAAESTSLPNLATLIKTFAQATGQTHEQVLPN